MRIAAARPPRARRADRGAALLQRRSISRGFARLPRRGLCRRGSPDRRNRIGRGRRGERHHGRDVPAAAMRVHAASVLTTPSRCAMRRAAAAPDSSAPSM